MRNFSPAAALRSKPAGSDWRGCWSGSRKLDAIYFSNDDLAIGGYFHCLENGISVPGQLALFGYNGLEIARLTPQPLSTIRSPRVAMGEMGAKLLLGGRPGPGRRTWVLS